MADKISEVVKPLAILTKGPVFRVHLPQDGCSCPHLFL